MEEEQEEVRGIADSSEEETFERRKRDSTGASGERGGVVRGNFLNPLLRRLQRLRGVKSENVDATGKSDNGNSSSDGGGDGDGSSRHTSSHDMKKSLSEPISRRRVAVKTRASLLEILVDTKEMPSLSTDEAREDSLNEDRERKTATDDNTSSSSSEDSVKKSMQGDVDWLKGCENSDQAEYKNWRGTFVPIILAIQRHALVVEEKRTSLLLGRSYRHVHHFASIRSVNRSETNKCLLIIEFEISSMTKGGRQFYEAASEEIAFAWTQRISRALRKYRAASLSRHLARASSRGHSIQHSKPSKIVRPAANLANHFQSLHPAVNSSKFVSSSAAIEMSHFFEDCGCRHEKWVDIGYLWKSTRGILSDFALQHFRLNEATGEFEYREPEFRGHAIFDQAPKGSCFLNGAEVAAVERVGAFHQVTLRCKSNLNADGGKNTTLKLRTKSKLRFDNLLTKICALSRADARSTTSQLRSPSRTSPRNIARAKESAKASFSKRQGVAEGAPIELDARRLSRERNIAKLRKLTGENPSMLILPRASHHIPDTVLQRSFGKRVMEKTSIGNVTRSLVLRLVPTFEKVMGANVTEYLWSRIRLDGPETSPGGSKSTESQKSTKFLEKCGSFLIKSTTSRSRVRNFSSMSSNPSLSSLSEGPVSDRETRRRTSTALSQDEKSAALEQRGPSTLLGPILVVVKGEGKESGREIMIAMVSENDDLELHRLGEEDEEPAIFLAAKNVVIRMLDVWNLRIEMKIARDVEDDEPAGVDSVDSISMTIELQGWHSTPQQLAQLLASLARGGSTICMASVTFVEECAMIETHASYRKHVMETLSQYRSKRPLRDWQPMSHFLTSAEIKDAEYRLQKELSSVDFMMRYFKAAVMASGDVSGGNKTTTTTIDCDGDDVVMNEERMWSKLSGKHAIFVLGPSAVGKTFSTRNTLNKVLKANGWAAGMSFISLDGGIVRESSVEWSAMTHKSAESKTCTYKGISNLFSGMFKSESDSFKKRLFKACIRHRRNLIIPETAASAVPGVPSKIGWYIAELRRAGYKVVMTAVSATREKCRQNGVAREIKEGKKYSNLSWMWAVDKISTCFEHARRSGYAKETFFIVENSDWNDVRTIVVPPHYGVRCSVQSQITEHVKVRSKFSSYSGEYEDDSVPYFFLYMLPPQHTSDMRRVHRGVVRMKLDDKNAAFFEAALQLCTYGRSLWIAWYSTSSERSATETKFLCIGRKSILLAGEDDMAQEILKSSELGSAKISPRKSRWRPSRKKLHGDSKLARRMFVLIAYEPSHQRQSISAEDVVANSTSSPVEASSDTNDFPTSRDRSESRETKTILIVQVVEEAERDQWLKQIRTGIHAVGTSTAAAMKKSAEAYFTTPRAEISRASLESHLTQTHDRAVVEINRELIGELLEQRKRAMLSFA